jgi:hypothetical protein
VGFCITPGRFNGTIKYEIMHGRIPHGSVRDKVASHYKILYLPGNIKKSHGNSFRMVDTEAAVRTVTFKYTLVTLRPPILLCKNFKLISFLKLGATSIK